MKEKGIDYVSGILRLESLTKGNTLKQGDKTPLKYRLFDADGEKLNIAGKSASVRLVYPDFLTIGYEKEGLTVAQDDTVTFTIDKVIPAKLYHVEIIVDNKFIFPSRADESKFTVDKSSLGTESSIIEIVGVDAVVRKAVDLINKDPNLIIDEDKLVTDIISNTGIGSIEEYHQQFNDVIKELSEEKDYHSLPEIAGARRGYSTLAESLGNLSVNMINKNLGKLDQTFMTDEFLQQMAGDTPINAMPADGSITLTKTTFSKIVSKNKFDLSSAELGRLIEDGTVADNVTSVLYTSGFMRFNPNDVVRTNFSLQSSAVYDINKKLITATLNTIHTQVIMPPNGHYLRVTRLADRIDEFMVYTGEAPSTYDPFKRVIDGSYVSGIDGETIKDKTISDDKLTFVTHGKNLLNPNDVIEGVYLNPDNGALQSNSAYNTTTIISASPNEKYTITHPRFIVFYGQDGKFIPNASISIASPPNNYTITLPSDAYGFQYSYVASNTDMQIEKGDVFTPYEPYAKMLDGMSIKPSNVIKYGAEVTKSSSKGDLTDGQRLTAGSANSLKKNKTYSFSANITSFWGLRMGQGERDYGGSYVEITPSELRFFDYRAEVTPRAVLNHGLTIANFIDVLITIDKDANAIVRIVTDGGFYESTPQKWEGYNGVPFAKSMGSVLTEGEFTFDTSDFEKPIYFFGDSYAGLTAKDRWVNYIREWGFDNWLVNGYPGQASLSAKGMLDFALSKGNPEILIWGLGMNDRDSSSAVNTNWLNTYNQIKAICESRDIELILCTIPNVPSINNSFKNEIIRNSGYRYIDFAKAVGAEEVGSNWHTGMLSADEVHPAILGAQKLALQAIKDVPELASN